MKRRKSGSLNTDDLPDEVLILVFSNLRPSELASCSGTSKRWYSLCTHSILWKTVMFVNKERLSLRQLSAFSTTAVARSVVSMTLEGYVQRTNSFGNSTSIVSKSVLHKISRNMVSLKVLKIEQANLKNVNLAMFPTSLKTISLFSCIIDDQFANDRDLRTKISKFGNLKNMSFAYVHKLDSSLCKSLRAFTWLESIDLTHCFRLSKRDLLDLSKQMKNLKIANISELRAVDDDVFLAFVRLKNLESLHVAFTITSNHAIDKMCSEKVHNLRYLDIRGCTNMTGDILQPIKDLTNIVEVRIHRNMIGFADARKNHLQSCDRPIRVLDEVDTGALAIPLYLERIQQMRDINFF